LILRGYGKVQQFQDNQCNPFPLVTSWVECMD
jgi:hypothetical protein